MCVWEIIETWGQGRPFTVQGNNTKTKNKHDRLTENGSVSIIACAVAAAAWLIPSCPRDEGNGWTIAAPPPPSFKSWFPTCIYVYIHERFYLPSYTVPGSRSVIRRPCSRDRIHVHKLICRSRFILFPRTHAHIRSHTLLISTSVMMWHMGEYCYTDCLALKDESDLEIPSRIWL